jgi:ATP-binding cassette, subfamily B, multidrug efflux pump
MKLYQPYWRRFGGKFSVAVFCVMSEAVCDLLGPTLMALMINEGIVTGNLSRVFYWSGLMLVVTVVGAGFAMTRNVLASQVSQRFGAALRYDLFQKILHTAQWQVDELTISSLITRMTNDTGQVILFINGLMRIFLKAPIICAGSIIFATLLNWRLSLVVYGAVSIITLLIYLSLKVSYPRYAQLQVMIDRMNAVVQEYLVGIRLVKAFGTYELEQMKFDQANEGLLGQSIKAQMIMMVLTPLITLFIGVSVVVLIYVGSQLFLVGLADAGAMAAFMIYMAQMLTALVMITNIFNIFVRTKASTTRILEVFHAIDDGVGGEQQPVIKGNIVFDQVSFTYPSGSGIPVLMDLSFSIMQGEKIAVIGPTGSGKSTLGYLLLQLYDQQQGKIYLDDQEIIKFPKRYLRQQIAYVPQKPMLFAGTIKDNLLWGQQMDDEQLFEWLMVAQANFVMDLEQQWSTYCYAGAVNLSGGQQQRLSIARGLVKQSPIMILDDVTSALDSITEAKLRKALINPNNPQTLIIITQKCSTAMFADRIMVMEHGRVVGFDHHHNLMRTCPTYQAIYHSQISKEVYHD